MKKVVKKNIYIILPLYILGRIIDFGINDDTRPPPVKDYPLIEFEKEEYQVKDMVTGKVLGSFKLSKEGDELFLLEVYGDPCSGTLMKGEYGYEYEFNSMYEFDVKLEKITCKNLEFYTGKSSDLWYTIVIMSLDKYDYVEYYTSENNRYLFYIIKDGDYNFATKDSAVYDLYIGMGSSIIGGDMRYAAILE